jgi:hypothetical protein
MTEPTKWRAAIVLIFVVALSMLWGATCASAQQTVLVFTEEASAQAQEMYAKSISDDVEQIGCVKSVFVFGRPAPLPFETHASLFAQDTLYITAISNLNEENATHGNVRALEALEVCKPPEWLGIIHTHPLYELSTRAMKVSATYGYFSKNDMSMYAWWGIRNGPIRATHCVLYTKTRAFCRRSSALEAPKSILEIDGKY